MQAESMSIYYLLILLGGMLTTNIENQKLQEAVTPDVDSVVLRIEVKSFEVKEIAPSEIGLILNLKLELLKNGSKPLIFLETKRPKLFGAALAKNRDELLSSKTLVFEYHGESVDTSPEWTSLRNALDQQLPPLDEVRILAPNESWKWEDIVGIALPKISGKNYFSDKRESWDNIKQLPTVWLQVICNVWPENLESKNSRDRRQYPFGNKLQKRWRNIGLLWLDNITSEPIVLDLKNSAVR